MAEDQWGWRIRFDVYIEGRRPTDEELLSASQFIGWGLGDVEHAGVQVAPVQTKPEDMQLS